MNKFIARIVILVTTALLQASLAVGAEPEEWYCAGYIKTIMPELSSEVVEQVKETTPVDITKTIPGDLVFFGKIGGRWGCPNGFSGFVLDVEDGFITFVTGVSTPHEQAILFPTEKYQGNTWYKLKPDIRTYQAETDPPRPGDKDYKPSK